MELARRRFIKEPRNASPRRRLFNRLWKRIFERGIGKIDDRFFRNGWLAVLFRRCGLVGGKIPLARILREEAQ